MIPGTEWREAYDLEILYMGEIDVGRVDRRGGRNNSPRWIFTLGRAQSFWHDARTFALAKGAVEDHLADWLMRAGLR